MSTVDTTIDTDTDERWLTPGVRGIGGASLAGRRRPGDSDSLLPLLLTSTLGAPAAALGIIEGVAEGLAAARFGGGALADDPQRRRAIAGSGFKSLAEGAKVEYEVEQSPKGPGRAPRGPSAANVRTI